MQNLSSVFVFRCDGQQLQQHHTFFIISHFMYKIPLAARYVCVAMRVNKMFVLASTCRVLLCGGKMHTKYVQIVALCCARVQRRTPFFYWNLLTYKFIFLRDSFDAFISRCSPIPTEFSFLSLLQRSARVFCCWLYVSFLFSLCVRPSPPMRRRVYLKANFYGNIMLFCGEKIESKIYSSPETHSLYIRDSLLNYNIKF